MTASVGLLSLAGSCFENETQGFVDPRCLTTLKKVATFIWFVNASDVVWKIETCLSNFNDVADDSDRCYVCEYLVAPLKRHTLFTSFTNIFISDFDVKCRLSLSFYAKSVPYVSGLDSLRVYSIQV